MVVQIKEDVGLKEYLEVFSNFMEILMDMFLIFCW